ncbi:TlpA family protein disulfide reductase [Paenimyroides viscosum]|uniref:TlpA family protein disulfide reductase n=1 Tax=Paenimyroides viscosum TaxID=2488729 RepID=A0A3P1B468_9FLAO|nr:TlpA disulfide reductase family protein [Paenimyroides viscosum]RRA95413.1 TlpA family protein disulfide reductase [Paenimyroides viscosum]
MRQLFKYTVLLFTFVFLQQTGIAQTSTNPPKEFVLNNGKTIQLNDLKGKVVLLDFWYRGCLPCLKATPVLMKLQEEFKNDLVIIGINDRDDKEDISDYYAYKKNIHYFSTYKTETDISKILKINAFPTFIIINQKGEIAKTEIGFDKGNIRKTIKKLIKENKS